MRKLLVAVCRHTQTDANAEDRYCADLDLPINALGEAQAMALAATLAGLPLRAVLCSDLLRTRQVAERIAAPHGVPVRSDARLRGVRLGLVTGMLKSEAKARYPAPHLSTTHPAFDFTSIGGESKAQVVDRHRACFDDLLETYGVEAGAAPIPVVAVVGHGRALQGFLTAIGVAGKVVQAEYVLVEYSSS